MSHTKSIRHYCELVHSLLETTEEKPSLFKKALNEARNTENPNVEYIDTPGKVTAVASSHISGKYTKLFNKQREIDRMAAELKKLQEEVKEQRREDVADLFDADDAVLTRVILTKKLIITMSKDPKPTETPQYKLILTELEKHLTTELKNVLAALLKEHRTIVEKSPTLKYDLIDEDDTNDTSSATLLAQKVLRWAPKFDEKLSKLQQMI